MSSSKSPASWLVPGENLSEGEMDQDGWRTLLSAQFLADTDFFPSLDLHDPSVMDDEFDGTVANGPGGVRHLAQCGFEGYVSD